MKQIQYLDKSLCPEQRSVLLLAEMGLDEKLAQLGSYFLRDMDFESLKKNHPFGVGQISCLEMRTLKTIEECVAFQQKAQQMAMDQSEHAIPAIFHMEGVCGAYIQGAVSFPSGINRGSSWNPQLEEEIGRIISRQERALGITQIFAPVLDVARDSRLGRMGESYGEDPVLAASMGTAFTRGIQDGDHNRLRSDAVAKHFVGSHNSLGGIHGAAGEMGLPLISEVYAKPFQAAISEAGLKGIMPCYSTINGEPASVSHKILTNMLRDEMGFDGLTVSDYSAIYNVYHVQKMYDSCATAGLKSLEAGMDQELPNTQCFNDELKNWFAEGKADMKILDQAVKRVLTAKFRMGLFENPFALEGEDLTQEFFSTDDRAVTEQSARESMVLLKNNGTLPLSPKLKKIAVVGCHAASARYMFGGYSHYSMAEGLLAAMNSMAGVNIEKKTSPIETYPGSQVQRDDFISDELINHIAPSAKSLLDELRRKMPECEIVHAYAYPPAGDDQSGHAEAMKLIAEADLAILTLGGKHGTSSIASMGEGVDATEINLPVGQEQFICKAAALGKPLVGVHFNGRPISSNAADEHLDSILEAWSPSESGAEAIADVLTGAYNPGGKLPVSVPHNSGQIPVFYNHQNGSCYHQGESVGFPQYVDLPHTPRYFFGYGLSYTDFEYSSLKIDRERVCPDGAVKISVNVKNTGKVTGDEVVQLYLADRNASMTRPVMELQGFSRISLIQGESQKLIFTVRTDQMAFLTADGQWKVEAGIIDVLVGSSSRDIHLQGSFSIDADLCIQGKKRGFYADVQFQKI